MSRYENDHREFLVRQQVRRYTAAFGEQWPTGAITHMARAMGCGRTLINRLREEERASA